MTEPTSLIGIDPATQVPQDGLEASDATPLAACLFILPSLNFAGWVSQIELAAKKVGLAVVVDDGVGVVAEPASAILITDKPDRAATSKAQRLIVLMQDMGDVVAASQAAAGGHIATTSMHASSTLALATELRATSWVTQAEADQALELWPGFLVTPPATVLGSLGSAEEQALIGALQIYKDGVPAIGARAQWGPPIFSYDGRRAELRPSRWEIDVIGPARYLVFGPYLTLSVGRWRATVRFAVDSNAALLAYRAEWGARTDFVSSSFTPGRSGVFEIALEYDFVETAQSELRIVQTQGSLGGAFEFMGMELERMG